MTPSRKLYLAAALVAAGYGVAALLGAPNLPYLPRSLPSDGAKLDQQVATEANHALSGHFAAGSARLLPDVAAADSTNTSGDFAASSATPHRHVASPIDGDSMSSSKTAAVADDTAWSAHSAGFAPRAKLRNEAPRPLAIEPRLPATVKSLQPIPIPPADLVMPAQYAVSGATSSFEAPATYEAAAGTPGGAAALAPLLCPPSADADTTRTHIVDDGDSLAKLAGRYLDDPHRGGEIYELNRHLLASPELLPIGVELAIPARTGPTAVGGESPRGLAPRTVAIHAAAHGGLVPVRPVPSAAGMMPRAQLARPLPAE